MTGWRVGYIAGPKHFVTACNKLQSQVSYIFLLATLSCKSYMINIFFQISSTHIVFISCNNAVTDLLELSWVSTSYLLILLNLFCVFKFSSLQGPVVYLRKLELLH